MYNRSNLNPYIGHLWSVLLAITAVVPVQCRSSQASYRPYTPLPTVFTWTSSISLATRAKATTKAAVLTTTPINSLITNGESTARHRHRRCFCGTLETVTMKHSGNGDVHRRNHNSVGKTKGSNHAIQLARLAKSKRRQRATSRRPMATANGSNRAKLSPRIFTIPSTPRILMIPSAQHLTLCRQRNAR